MTSDDDPPLSMEELEKIRFDLQASIHKTEEMLAKLEALLIAAALLKQGQILPPPDAPGAPGAPGASGWKSATGTAQTRA